MDAQYEQYSDFEIIRRINNGDVKLFEILIRRYNPLLYRIGRTYRYNHQDTEDLMQDAYINAYSHLDQFENRASFKTWLTRIMLNGCYQKNHRQSFKNEINDDSIQDGKSNFLLHYSHNNEKMAMNKELGRVIENAVHNIPEDYRIVFTLRELNGLNVAETANVLNITESNVKVRLNRAKGMLQREIKKMYSPEDIFEFNLLYCDSMVNKVMAKIFELKNTRNEK